MLHDASLWCMHAAGFCLGPAALTSAGVSQPPCCPACSIYFMLSGIIILQLLHNFQIHVDWITFSFVLYNFSVRRDKCTSAAACFECHQGLTSRLQRCAHTRLTP